MDMKNVIVFSIFFVFLVSLTGCKSEIDKCVEAAYKRYDITTQKEKDGTEYHFRTECLKAMSGK